MNQQTLMEKLEECKHYDKDNRYKIDLYIDFLGLWQQLIYVQRL
jgi:hypothetical protein